MTRSKFWAEAVGVFILVFTGTGAVVVNEVAGGRVTALGISLAFGLVVLALIYTLGHVSGAHLNPAVTLAFCAAGRHKASEFVPYAAAQLLGAVAASVALKLMFYGQRTTLGMTLPAGPAFQSLVMETILSFILMFTIMGVATDDRAEGAMAGIAVGAVIAVEAIFAGPVSGASMNPARSFGPALAAGNFSRHWIYWLGPMLGTVLGARAYQLIVAEKA
jgi:aquaporin Z